MARGSPTPLAIFKLSSFVGRMGWRMFYSMRIFDIPKKSGGARRIYAPSDEEKVILRSLLMELTVTVKPLDCWHGFVIGRGPLSNAEDHQGFRHTLSFDLAGFFPSVKRSLDPLKAYSGTRWDCCFPDGAAQQGLPTSPMLANIAARPVDEDFLTLIGGHAVYTRYADDLTFSSDSKAVLETVMEKAAEIVSRHGFTLNPRKTRWQDASFGRRIVTGLAVDDKCHVTRATRRKLRAAEHRGDADAVNGFEEWSLLVPPGTRRRKLLEKLGCEEDEQMAECWCADLRYSSAVEEPAVIRPDLRIGQKHVYYLPLTGRYSCNHIRISEATATGKAIPRDIRRMNAEEARLAVEAMGEQKYLDAIGAMPVQSDDWGELYALRGYNLVKLINSTRNPDGTVNTYFRAVPQTCITARAAIAWTFGLSEAEYSPESMS